MKPRHRLILQALLNLHKRATARDIARVAKLSVSGVVRSLAVLGDFVVPYKLNNQGEQVWKLIRKPPFFTAKQWQVMNERRVQLVHLGVQTENEFEELRTLNIYLDRHPNRLAFTADMKSIMGNSWALPTNEPCFGKGQTCPLCGHDMVSHGHIFKCLNCGETIPGPTP